MQLADALPAQLAAKLPMCRHAAIGKGAASSAARLRPDQRHGQSSVLPCPVQSGPACKHFFLSFPGDEFLSSIPLFFRGIPPSFLPSAISAAKAAEKGSPADGRLHLDHADEEGGQRRARKRNWRRSSLKI
eukprot:gene14755-biopygen645